MSASAAALLGAWPGQLRHALPVGGVRYKMGAILHLPYDAKHHRRLRIADISSAFVMYAEKASARRYVVRHFRASGRDQWHNALKNR